MPWCGRLLLPTVAVAIVSCGEDLTKPVPPGTQTMVITTVTSGSNVDLNGYVVIMTLHPGYGTVGPNPWRIGSNGTAEFGEGIALWGDETIALTDVAPNCTLAGPNPKPVVTHFVTFTVTCG